jgi:hypothetical protein
MNQIEQLSLRILAHARVGTGPKRPIRNADVGLAPKPTTIASTRNSIECDVARIIEAAPASGESVQRAFDRKEQELRALFLRLTRAERIALHSKLSVDRDNVSSVLARLTAERRSRVLARLAELSSGKAGGL